MRRILVLMRKEFIQTFRDRRMVGIIFIAPMLQLTLFGFAVTLDVNRATLAVWDQDRSADSRALVDAFVEARHFHLTGAIDREEEIEATLKTGRTDLVLVVPPTFSRDLAAGKTAAVQAVFDGTNSNYASIAAQFAEGVVARFNQRRMQEAVLRVVGLQAARTVALAPDAPAAALAAVSPAMPSLAPPDPSVRFWYNPDLKSQVYMVPAIVALLLLVVTTILTALAITREIEIGTMEHIIVTPIRPYQLILGKMAPFVVIGFVDVTLIVVAARILFDVPFLGSVPLLYLAAAFYLFTTLGLGLLFSTISRTQQQAMFLTFMFLQPAVLLSGFAFPIENMPDVLQVVTYANPLRYFLVIVRGIFLKGTGLAVLWPQFAALGGLGTAIFGLAAGRFKKTLG
jgi:ABC-2 type transport system permease protein